MASTVKEEIRALLEQLPDDVSWDRVVDTIELRRRVLRGLEDLSVGRTISHEQLMKELRSPG